MQRFGFVTAILAGFALAATLAVPGAASTDAQKELGVRAPSTGSIQRVKPSGKTAPGAGSSSSKASVPPSVRAEQFRHRAASDAQPTVAVTYLRVSEAKPATACMPKALGCTGAAGLVVTTPSTHFVPGGWQASWPAERA